MVKRSSDIIQFRFDEVNACCNAYSCIAMQYAYQCLQSNSIQMNVCLRRGFSEASVYSNDEENLVGKKPRNHLHPFENK